MKTCGDGLVTEWEEVVTALGYIGIDGHDIASLTRVLSGILITGDIEFEEAMGDSSRVSNPRKVINTEVFSALRYFEVTAIF